MNPWREFTNSGLHILVVVALALSTVVGVAYVTTMSDVPKQPVYSQHH
jgi:hypothetical protein